MFRKEKLTDERRRYVRLDTVFPVQFRLINKDTKEHCSDWFQGFTNNICKGGICLEVNNLCVDAVQLIKDNKVNLFLNMELPVTRKQIPVIAKIIWARPAGGGYDKYLVGISYEEIDPGKSRLIMRYVRLKKLFVPVSMAIIFILGAGLIANSYLNVKLIKGNKALVQQLVGIVQDSSIAKQKIKEVAVERQALQLKIQTLQSRIQVLEGVEEQDILLKKLVAQKNDLQDKMVALQHKETSITEDLLHLDKKKAILEKANLDKMYQWLQVHQNPRTGLVMSFEGDSNIGNWAFIYDQSLALQAYANFSDFERARRLLDFFEKKAQKKDGLFLNAYYATDGSPAEYTVHSGPNIWIGIAILQYTKRIQNNQYLPLAEEIAGGVISLQDKDGGIRGGPDLNWYSTEHNLDAYAFFNMLYQITAKPGYKVACDKILTWLTNHTYSDKDVPIKRGKGDSTIATDTYAWSIAAVGPEKLDELGMNPDRIMEFAEKHCSTEVVFNRPEGYCVRIKGFDFAPERNLARGGVVSSEWTAQMVIAFKIMSDYYYKKGLKAKAHAYEVKADEYMASLGKMIISSPSPSGQGQSCLPYATEQFVDTGHGWTTPKGDSTGCVSGTAYTLFAYYDYNPLSVKE